MITIKEYVALKKEELAKRILQMNNKPVIKIIQVNDDYASNSYIKGKIKDVNEIGAKAILEKLPIDISEQELLKEIRKTNEDPNVNGFIVQLPLPKHISEEKVKLAINPKKDLDGFNVLSKFKSATPNGILTFLEDNHYEFKKSAFLFDVGINRDKDNKLTGDCEKDLPVSFQSPVPGGVGLLTRLALLLNLMEACE